MYNVNVRMCKMNKSRPPSLGFELRYFAVEPQAPSYDKSSFLNRLTQSACDVIHSSLTWLSESASQLAEFPSVSSSSQSFDQAWSSPPPPICAHNTHALNGDGPNYFRDKANAQLTTPMVLLIVSVSCINGQADATGSFAQWNYFFLIF